MKDIEYLIGSPDISKAPLSAYSEETIRFASLLSRNLMKSPKLREYPDISALAFWCRHSNLIKMRDNCVESDERIGRGLCFHIAPGNVPINFAFSYLFGLLSGCSNIVRLSSKSYFQVDIVCDAIGNSLEGCPDVKKRTAIIRYPASDEITTEFCANADARVIWGGDRTITKIRAMPSKPKCVDICFADRYSICIIDGDKVKNADEFTMNQLVNNFYNDTYLMDQNACSSEQLIFWLNDSDIVRDKFWNSLLNLVRTKYDFQTAVSMDKYVQVFEDILDGRKIKRIDMKSNFLYRVELSELEGNLTEMRGYGGYFYEYSLNDLCEIEPFITDKFQTVTYFGIDPKSVRAFVLENNLRGIDRIVPIGKAMDIGIIWDGFDLVRMLSRLIEVT